MVGQTNWLGGDTILEQIWLGLYQDIVSRPDYYCPFTFRLLAGTPKQATIARNGGKMEGKIQLFPGYEECLDELEGFDYIWVITLMHLNSGFKKKIKPQPREGNLSRALDMKKYFSCSLICF